MKHATIAIDRITTNIILVGDGGMLGSILRFLIGHSINPVPHSAFPYGTFTVNVVRSMLIGMIFGLSQRNEWMTPECRELPVFSSA